VQSKYSTHRRTIKSERLQKPKAGKLLQAQHLEGLIVGALQHPVKNYMRTVIIII
jgi:hypothetical protein